jgi:hypothetical protein
MPEIHPRTITLRGKRWTLCTHPMKDNFGLCEYETWVPKKHIWIDPGCEGEKMLEILLHEMMHCCFPDIDEDAITETGRSLAKVLWDLGYRSEWDE